MTNWEIIVSLGGLITVVTTIYYLFRYERRRKLKKQKSVLEPILKLKIEDFVTLSKRTETKGNTTKNITSYNVGFGHEKVYKILREVKKHEIEDVMILNKLEEVLLIERNNLIIWEQNGKQYYFNEKLQELIYDIKVYLSYVI